MSNLMLTRDLISNITDAICKHKKLGKVTPIQDFPFNYFVCYPNKLDSTDLSLVWGYITDSAKENIEYDCYTTLFVSIDRGVSPEQLEVKHTNIYCRGRNEPVTLVKCPKDELDDIYIFGNNYYVLEHLNPCVTSKKNKDGWEKLSLISKYSKR